jgi:hypothetical protein
MTTVRRGGQPPRLAIDSYDPKVQKNTDGSVDVYCGPAAPGKPSFSFFRFSGPEKAVFDKR